MSPHPHDPPMAADTVYLGLYLDAETTGAAHVANLARPSPTLTDTHSGVWPGR